MRALFGNLSPDQPDMLNGSMEDAVNCIPYEQSYGPFLGPAVASASLSATCIGATSMKSIAGNAITFAASVRALWKESAGAVNDVSRTASYNTATDARVEFAQFGNTGLSVNGADTLQVWTLDTSTQWLDASASSSAPVAANIAIVKDFVFLGNITNAQNRVQWSQINNPLRYTFSRQLQSDFQDIPGSSTIRKVTGGDFGLVITEESCHRFSYVGSPLFFRRDETAVGVGTNVSGLVARHQNLSIFYSTRGWVAHDGENAHPIGQGYIDEHFKDIFESGSKHNCSSTIDPYNNLYIGLFPNRSGTGAPNQLILWRIGTDKFAWVDLSLDFIFSALSGGYTLDGLDAVMADIDAGEISLDSDAWKGGLKMLGAFDSAHRLVRFDGDALTARFITGEAQIVEDGRAFIRAVRPLIEGSASTEISAYVGGRDRLIDSVSWTSAVAMNSIGKCPFRNNQRYQRLRVDVSGGFDRAYGADVDLTTAGQR